MIEDFFYRTRVNRRLMKHMNEEVRYQLVNVSNKGVKINLLGNHEHVDAHAFNFYVID